MSEIISGNSINLFIKRQNEWHTIAHSTSFSLELRTKYKQVTSKEDENYSIRLDNITWNLQGESLVVDDDVLFDIVNNKEKIRICYGIVNEGQTEPPQTGYIGECWISSLELDANTGDIATYKYELEGAGALLYGDISEIDDDDDIYYNERLEPTLAFEDPNRTVTLNDDNDYDISDLLNPHNLPIRFMVKKVVTF